MENCIPNLPIAAKHVHAAIRDIMNDKLLVEFPKNGGT